ncbi:NUDIX domain-containing protein [Streptomyces sp. NPDC048385]|uniref:NUDIX domain-containing protein n=1 Tax=Streptomyces sp. NPDC048385 TaxID=3155145 RepID=UPI00341700A5
MYDEALGKSSSRDSFDTTRGSSSRITEINLAELRVRPGAGLILSDGAGRVLLMRRSGEGTWGIPGGGVEPGEAWSAAALRECREETGWLARIDGLLGVYSDPGTQVHRYPNGALEQLLGVVFRATAIKRVGVPDNETAELRWVLPDRLPVPLFAPDIPVLRDAFSETTAWPIIG